MKALLEEGALHFSRVTRAACASQSAAMKRLWNTMGGLLMLAAAGCGTAMTGNDGAAGDAAGDAASTGDTGAVSANGTYVTTAAQVSGIADTCSTPPVTPGDLAGFTVVIASMGGTTSVTLNGTGGVALLMGTLNGNTAMLTSSAQAVSGSCQYMRDLRATLTLNAGGSLSLSFMQSASNFTSVAGMTCMGPAAGSCTVSWMGTFTRS